MYRSMLGLALAISVSFLTVKAYSQESFTGKRTLYIVRHAEKDTGSNPALSATGLKRAGDLYRTLRKKKIQLIFVSQYRRTAMTADSLRIYQNIDTVQYKADATGDKLFETMAARAGKAKRILIVGHSNTVPAIIRKAGVEGYTIRELPETEYDNLFIVEQKKGKATLKQERFGAANH